MIILKHRSVRVIAENITGYCPSLYGDGKIIFETTGADDSGIVFSWLEKGTNPEDVVIEEKLVKIDEILLAGIPGIYEI